MIINNLRKRFAAAAIGLTMAVTSAITAFATDLPSRKAPPEYIPPALTQSPYGALLLDSVNAGVVDGLGSALQIAGKNYNNIRTGYSFGVTTKQGCNVCIYSGGEVQNYNSSSVSSINQLKAGVVAFGISGLGTAGAELAGIQMRPIDILLNRPQAITGPLSFSQPKVFALGEAIFAHLGISEAAAFGARAVAPGHINTTYHNTVWDQSDNFTMNDSFSSVPYRLSGKATARAGAYNALAKLATFTLRF